MVRFYICAQARRTRCDSFELRDIVRRKSRAVGRQGGLSKVDLSAANFTRLAKALARMLPERERCAIDKLPIYLDYLSGAQQFGNSTSLERLAKYGINPPDNDQVLDRVLAYYLITAR